MGLGAIDSDFLNADGGFLESCFFSSGAFSTGVGASLAPQRPTAMKR